MSFSQITRAERSGGGNAAGLLDPLVEAWTLVRQVRQVEYESERARSWLRAVQALAAGAERAVRDHSLRCSAAGSLVSKFAGRPGETGVLARRHQQDERRALDAIRAFGRLCQHGDATDIWRVVEVTEAAIELEMLVARTHNQLAALCERAPVCRTVAS